MSKEQGKEQPQGKILFESQGHSQTAANVQQRVVGIIKSPSGSQTAANVVRVQSTPAPKPKPRGN